MSRTTLAAVAALALLPAPALASAPPDTLPESYPAVRWQPVDSIELLELTRAVAGTNNRDTIALFRRRQAPGAVINAKGDAFRWWAAPVSDKLRRLLPGVRFFHEEHHTYSNPDGPYHSSVAVYKDRRYGLQSLNRLLADCGFKFDSSEIPAIAEIAVLWTLLDRQARLHIDPGPKAHAIGAPPPDSAALATAIPAVTFRKIGWGEWQHPTHHGFTRKAVRIDLLVDGIARAAWMMPGIGDLVPMWLNLDGQVSTFYQGSEIKQPAEAPPAPQK